MAAPPLATEGSLVTQGANSNTGSRPQMLSSGDVSGKFGGGEALTLDGVLVASVIDFDG